MTAAAANDNSDADARHPDMERPEYRRLEQAARKAARAEVAEAQRQLAQRNAALNAQAAEVAVQRDRLDMLAHQLHIQESKLRQEHTELDLQTEQMRRRAENLAARFRAQRQALRQHVAVVRNHERELEKRTQRARDEIVALRAELRQRQAELDARGAQLEVSEGNLNTRWEELDQREQHFNEQLAAQEADQRRLAELETELARRRKSADEARRKAEEIERQARQYHEEALALREQAEERDSESRQAALALELERQELQRDKTVIEEAREGLDALRSQREQDLTRARGLLREQAEQVRQAQRSLLAAPRRWWLRSGGMSVAAAILTAVVWLAWHPALYRSTTEIRIISTVAAGPRTGRDDRSEAGPSQEGNVAAGPRTGRSPATLPAAETDAPAAPGSPLARVLAEHRRAVLDPRLLADDDLANEWAEACAAERVTVTAAKKKLVLLLSVTGPDFRDAERLVQAAADTYQRRVNSVPADVNLPRHYYDFLAWQDELQTAREEKKLERAGDEAALAKTPNPEQRERMVAEADRLENEMAGVTASLEEQRAALAVLLAAKVPPGRVDPADVEDALTLDAICQEDHKEYHAVASKYRTELTVSMLLLVDPLKSVRQVLADYAASLAEQRELNPPAELTPTLETCAAEVAQIRSRFAEFAVQWRTWVEEVQGLDVSPDAVEQAVVDLVQRQRDVAGAVRRLSNDVDKFVSENAARVEGLDAGGNGGTRAVVVAAVLRGEHAAVKTVVAAYLEAAEKIALTENVELDAQDRQLRALRMRLDQRRELVHERLQLQADRVARERHAARLDEVRERVLRLERRREELVRDLTAALRTVRGLDEAVRRYDELVGRLQQDDADIARLEARIDELKEKLDSARRQGPSPDRVRAGQPVTGPVRQARYRHAVLAAMVALAATWLVCVLMITKHPWRRGEADQLAELLTSNEAERE
ncbi:MAG: hypothetical protein KAY37_07575 [Phycisphaerae bacterium]|nr:hypothetical protein [Phycisphaerae bacterium]